MVHFVGAGSGAPDLITVRGARLLKEADVVIYAGSLVNPALLDYCRPGCRIYNSAEMTLEQVIAAIEEAEAAGLTTVRLHTGDSSIYGAVREQMDLLDREGLRGGSGEEQYLVSGDPEAFQEAASLLLGRSIAGLVRSVPVMRIEL